jgi:hypothetical protein
LRAIQCFSASRDIIPLLVALRAPIIHGSDIVCQLRRMFWETGAMQRGKKITAALVLLGLGLGTALLFRRAESPTSREALSPPTPQKEALVLRESPVERMPPSLGKGAVPLKPARGVKPPRDLQAPIATPPQLGAPPELPAVFDRSLAATGSEDPRGIAALARLEARASLSGANTIPQGPAPLRTHRIVDGDTLSRLAARFLDDASRSDEIYAINEAQLPDPNILPIGVELKIPPREGSLASRTSPAIVSVPSSGKSRAKVDPLPAASEVGGLVPVPAGQPHE